MLLDSKQNLKFEAFIQNLNLTKTNMTQNNNLKGNALV